MENKLYFIKRTQYVSYKEHTSELLQILCSVPQCCILGPLLIRIYVNDNIMCNVSKLLKFISFADDSK